MPQQGQLEKMRIEAFSGPELRDDQKVGEFRALVNPETYSVEFKMETSGGQGQGTSGAQQRYAFKKPEEFTFEFLFDNTGIIDGNPNPDGVIDDINSFKDLTIKHEGDTHEPRFLQLTWGTFQFKGRLTSMNITFKLFNPDGSPIRATVKITVKGSVEEEFRLRTERNSSPDLTHSRTVASGDTLPWMCYKIYGDPKYYLEVAKANNLSNFRRLEVGSNIFFPPFNKNIS